MAMSTKSTLAHGTDFHLFKELMEEGEDVYLQLEGPDVEFSASPGYVTVRIPAHIWETIRTVQATALSYADKTDAELQAIVETNVDERIAEYNAVSKSNKTLRGLLAFAASGVYGNVDSPRKDQIAAGLEYFKTLRDYERSVRDKIAAYKTTLSDALGPNDAILRFVFRPLAMFTAYSRAVVCSSTCIPS